MKTLATPILTFLTVLQLLTTGCAKQHETASTIQNKPEDTELQRVVGQNVTLSGKFELAGKIGPYIHRNGEPVYVPLAWGSKYEHMQGKAVSITGILRFRHFQRDITNTIVDQPFDYFYLDVDTAKIKAE